MALKYHAAVADWQAGGKTGRRKDRQEERQAGGRKDRQEGRQAEGVIFLFPLCVSESVHNNFHQPSRLPICPGSMTLSKVPAL